MPMNSSASRPEARARRRSLLRRFAGEREGAAAIEFSLLALPFFLVFFASVETFVAFTGEQLLASAADKMSRKIRTGEITYAQGKATDMTTQQFRAAFCDEISIMMTCSNSEVSTPDKLFIDVRSFTNFNAIPKAVPRVGDSPTGNLDTSGFRFAPGGPRSINIVRAYYRWEVLTDLVRPYVTKLRPAGDDMPNDYLMVATNAFQNENY
ncbi:TadE/TadG family type IV pilus assembly protein [Ensifer soli]|uniref:TadE/TadG family type IV pilus assembly protein n=1 Tax=Ciceribacter sp. sgz301302 TaxID=3342379 RepID=UPI0035BB37D4